MPILRRTLGMTLSASLVAMALLVAAPGPVMAAMLVVDDDGMATPTDCEASDAAYLMIGDAVADAMSGDTIIVCPGTYNESVTINKDNITLLGAKAGVPAGPDPMPADRGVLGTESVVNGAPGATHVIRTTNNIVGTTIDGFTMNSNPARSTQAGVFIGANNSGPTVVNNIIRGMAPVPSGGGHGIRAGSFSDAEFGHNNIRGFRDGMNIDQTLGGSTPTASSVDSNYVANNLRTGVSTSADVVTSSFTNNLVEENGDAGIQVASGGHDISGNTIRLNVGSGIILVSTPRTDGVQILDNDLLDNEWGILLQTGEAGAENNVAHNNNIAGNVVGVENRHSALFDATCNWWGSPNGPMNVPDNPTGAGNPVVENPGEVEFIPWLVEPAPGGECIGGPLPAAGKATGGGQVPVPEGRGSFGFNARLDEGEATGHLNYRNHGTRAHLNCTVTTFIELSPTTATFSGTCNEQSSADSFTAHVEDHGEPGRNSDVFEITYDGSSTGTEGGKLTAGNIQIQVEPAAEPASAESSDSGATGAGEGAFPSGATFSGISLSGLEVGTGVSIGPDGAAAGQFVAVLQGTSLLGQPQEINVDGEVSSGSIGLDGSATFSGSATVDLGDGSVPLVGVPFTVTATTESVLVKLDTSMLPSATVTGGSITID